MAPEVHAAAYGLIDTYNSGNWLSMFDVQAVSLLSGARTHMD
jgi:hypothetical protein